MGIRNRIILVLLAVTMLTASSDAEVLNPTNCASAIGGIWFESINTCSVSTSHTLNSFIEINPGQSLIINSTGNLTINSGTIYNSGAIQIEGDYNNYGITMNFGFIGNIGKIESPRGANFNNSGIITNGGKINIGGVFNNTGSVMNNGTFNNTGDIFNYLDFSNYRVINNAGNIHNYGIFYNSPTGLIDNTYGMIYAHSPITNYGTINPGGGSIYIYSLGILDNKGVIGILSGEFHIEVDGGQFINQGQIIIPSGGLLSIGNSASLINTQGIIQSAGTIYICETCEINNIDGQISGTIEGPGSIIGNPPTYIFTGFFQPVDNTPTLNVIKAGSAVPVKFNLGGYKGLGIFWPDYPKSQTIDCYSNNPSDNIEETFTAGSSSLYFDVDANQYIYIWKTDKAWSGTCRQLVVKLDTGSEHTTYFKFKK